MQKLGILGTIGKQVASARVAATQPAPKPIVVQAAAIAEPTPTVQIVEIPVVAQPDPEPFLSVSESVEPAPQSTSLVEEETIVQEAVEEALIEAPSEEQSVEDSSE